MRLRLTRIFAVAVTLVVPTLAGAVTPTAMPTPTPAAIEVTPAASAVSASTNDGNVPANTVDKSLTTRWSGYGDGAWIAYDLGRERALSHVRIAFYNGNIRKSRFDLQVSADGVDWTTVRSAESFGTSTNLQSFDLPARGRHVRYLGHGFVTNTGSTGLWNSVNELEVWANTSDPPAAPTDVRAKAEVGQVRLTWSTVSNATSYEVWRRTESCARWLIATVVPQAGATQTYVDTAVVADQRYYYTVFARNFNDRSVSSETAAATPLQGTVIQTLPTPTPTRAPLEDVPLPPATLSATSSDNSVRLTWTSGSSGGWGDPRRWDNFIVFRSTGGTCGPYVRIAGMHAFAREYVDTDVTNGNTYYYVVAAVNALGESLDSPVATGQPQPRVPAAPVNVKAWYSIENSGTPTIYVEWDAGFDANSYVVRRATVPGGPYTTIAANVPKRAPTTSYADTAIAIGTTYYYVVAGQNAVGVGPNSAEVSRTALPPPPPPPNLTAEAGDQRVTLRWDAVPDAQYYACFGGTIAGGPYDVTETTASTSVVFVGRTNGTRYYFVCYTYTPYARSEVSPEVSAVPVAALPAPTNLAGRVMHDASGPAVTLWWAASQGAASYRIYRGTSSSDMTLLGTSSTTSFIDRAIKPGFTYYYAVSALNASGESPRSAWISLGVPIAHREIPLTPGQVTASTSDSNLPANTVDGSLATRWSGNGLGAWIRYDLGQVRQVGRVTIGVYGGNTRRNRFTLVLSDGSTETQYPRQSSGTTTMEEAHDFPVQSVRYVTYVGQGSTNSSTGATSTWNSLTEVSVYEAYVPTPSPTPTPTCAPFPYPPTPPPPPSNVTAAPGDGVVILSWTGSPPPYGWSSTFYEVWRSPTSNGTYELVHTTSSQSFTDSLGVPAYYKVRQVIPYTSGFYPPCPNKPERADGAFSAPVYGAPNGTIPTPTPTPTCVPPPPLPSQAPPPTDVSATGGNGQITVRWTSSWAKNRVLRATTSGGPYGVLADVANSTQGEFVDRAVIVGQRYYYQVQVYERRTSEPGCPAWTWTYSGPPSPEVSAVATGTGGCVKWQAPQPVPLTASTHDGNVPANAMDENLSTRWSGYGDGAWLKVDLGAARSVCAVKVAFYRGNERQYRFELATSNDNTTWALLMTNGRSSGTTTALETFHITPPVSTRWIRYVGFGNTVNPWNGIPELEIWVVP